MTRTTIDMLAPLYEGSLAFSVAGALRISDVGDVGTVVDLSDTQNGTTAIIGSSTVPSYSGRWIVDAGALGGPSNGKELAAGLHALQATEYAAGHVGASLAQSAVTNVLVGTAGGDTLQGLVLGSTGITGPRFVFGGLGSDVVQAYSIASGTTSHVGGGVITVDGGFPVQGTTDNNTLVIPVNLGSVQYRTVYDSTETATETETFLTTSDATVGFANIQTLRFNDYTITVQPLDQLVNYLYYDQRYPDVAAANANTRTHYETFGWHEGRDPDAFFSTNGYLAANADVRAADISPLDHYVTTGWKEGRDPSAAFDNNLYLKLNPDVAGQFISPLQHYLQFGITEGRRFLPVIDSAHIQQGLFDPTYYKLANPDVGLSGADPLGHFLQYGAAEGRNPDSFFDVKYYLSNNPDVAASGINPMLHYELYGWHEGRDPSAQFSTNGYLAANPDVKAAAIDPLQHFLQNGAAEGRLP